MTPTRLLPLAGLLLVAACGPSEPPPPAAPPPPPPPPPVTAEGPFAVTNDGVAGLTAASRLYIPDIQKAFPGSTGQEVYIDGPEVVSVVTVTGEHDLKLDILPAEAGPNIGAIAVGGGPVVGPGGGKVGDALSATGVPASACKPGKGRFAGRQLCAPADTPNVAYVVSGGKIREIYWSSGSVNAAAASAKPIPLTVKRG